MSQCVPHDGIFLFRCEHLWQMVIFVRWSYLLYPSMLSKKSPSLQTMTRHLHELSSQMGLMEVELDVHVELDVLQVPVHVIMRHELSPQEKGRGAMDSIIGGGAMNSITGGGAINFVTGGDAPNDIDGWGGGGGGGEEVCIDVT